MGDVNSDEPRAPEPDPTQRSVRGADLVIAGTLLGLVVCFHLAGLATNFNDKAVHRARAYVCVEGGSPGVRGVIEEARLVWPTGDPLDDRDDIDRSNRDGAR